MKKAYLIFFLLLHLSALSAQSFTITGSVNDENGKPIGFATVTLWSPDKQQLLKGCTSNDHGGFLLAEVPQGKYVLSCQFVGYKPWEQAAEVNQSIALGTITLQEDNRLLAEVEVTANRIQRKGNGYLVNMQDSRLSKGKSGMNVLTFLPGINVHNEQISINGRQGTVVYINGREVKNPQELQLMDAESIKNVEIIPVASAEYGLDANGGIIKIETRKPQEGGSTTLFGNRLIADSKGLKTEMLNGTFQYRNKRWSIYNMAMGGMGNYHPQDTRKSALYEGGNSTTSHYKARNHTRLAFADIFDLQYTINKKQQLGINASVRLLNDSLFKGSTSNRFKGEEMVQNSLMSGNGEARNNLVDVTTNYLDKLDNKGSKFLLKAAYTYRNSKKEEAYNYQTADIRHQESNLNKSTTHVAVVEPKLTYVFRNKGKLVSGLRYNYIYDTNHLSYQSNIHGEWESLPNHGESYDMYGTDYAAYLTYSQPFRNSWWLNAGLRYQKDKIKYEPATSDETVRKEYQGLYPSFTLSRLLNTDKRRMLSLSYRHYHSLPNFGYYSPARIVHSDNSYSTGNPDIDHELFHLVEMTYAHHANLDLIYSFKAGKDLIRVLTFEDSHADMVTYTKPVNIGNNRLHTFHIDYRLPIKKFCYIRLNGRLHYEHADFKEIAFDQFFYTADATFNLNFTSTWGGTVSGSYASRRRVADYKFKEDYSMDISTYKSFLKNKLSISLQVNNLFRQTSKTETTSEDKFATVSRNMNPKTEFIVGVTYRFSTGKKIKNISIMRGEGFSKSSAEQ